MPFKFEWDVALSLPSTTRFSEDKKFRIEEAIFGSRVFERWDNTVYLTSIKSL